MDLILPVLTGLCLAAACGFRISVPPLVACLAALSGHLTLPADFAWLGSWPALVALSVAAGAEVLAYAFPLVDHALDVLGAPAAVVAGTLLTASFTTGMDPYMRWSLALIAGGGLAAAVHGATSAVRVGSTATTAGTANPVFAFFELLGAMGLSLGALVLPVGAAALLAVAGVLAILWIRRRRAPRLRVTRAPQLDEAPLPERLER